MAHTPITGYRELSPDEIALINQIKAKGIEIDGLIAELAAAQADPRWLAIGRTDLQQGFMAITRAIAKPAGF
jgi:hypothetical protein